MSELRIALVAEGPTDYVVIEQSLKAVLGAQAFVLTLLQPENITPVFGNGWGGVLKWCETTALRRTGSLDADPLLAGFDFLIIHLDMDVAHKSYSDCGEPVVAMALQKNWPVLPCNQTCPPVAHTCAALQAVLTGWLGQATVGKKTVLCLPAQSTGTWLAAATLPAGHALLNGMECNPDVETSLSLLTLKLRIKKTTRDYRANAVAIRERWAQVKTLCGQAAVFESAVHAALS